MPTTSPIGSYTRTCYFGEDVHVELEQDIRKFAARVTTKDLDCERYWTERWGNIEDGLYISLLCQGGWLMAISYDTPGNPRHEDNHTSLYVVTPGCGTPVGVACDDWHMLSDSKSYIESRAADVRAADPKAVPDVSWVTTAGWRMAPGCTGPTRAVPGKEVQ
jgi:hypothetical protein